MFALRRSLTRPVLSPRHILPCTARLSCPLLVAHQANVRRYTTEENGATGANTILRRGHYGSGKLPSRNLFIHGIGSQATEGDKDEIVALFNGFANLTSVRMRKCLVVIRHQSLTDCNCV